VPGVGVIFWKEDMSGIALVKNLEMGTKKNEKRLEFG